MLESLGRLADAELVRQRQQGWGLVHDAVGDVLVSELSTTERVRWQARLAAALDSAHGDEAERARLWRDAGDRDRAATTTRRPRGVPSMTAPMTRRSGWPRTAWRWSPGGRAGGGTCAALRSTRPCSAAQG